jgi:hypothetical protein
MSDRQAESEQRVTALELFFDLVFVFAITQVTGFLADHSTWDGLVRGELPRPARRSRRTPATRRIARWTG